MDPVPDPEYWRKRAVLYRAKVGGFLGSSFESGSSPKSTSARPNMRNGGEMRTAAKSRKCAGLSKQEARLGAPNCLSSEIGCPMYEIRIQRKFVRWQWTVSGAAGNIIVVGREISRSEARYKSASALFQLLLRSSLCNFEK